MWIIYAIIGAVLNGFYAVFRKKAVVYSNIFFVLAMLASFGFIIISWDFGQAITLSWEYILLILGKSLIVALAWLFELVALKNYMISSLQPFTAVKVVISFVVAILVFSEPIVWYRFIGIAIIFFGLFFLNKNTKKEDEKVIPSNKARIKCITFFILGCVCSECSAIIDKVALSSISSMQMQWWFMLFVSAFLWIFFFLACIKSKKMLVRKIDWKNFYIYLAGAILVLGDQLFFKSLSEPDSLLSVVSIIKQISTIVSVIFGAYMFKEPNLKNKLIYLGFIMCGIIIILI